MIKRLNESFNYRQLEEIAKDVYDYLKEWHNDYDIIWSCAEQDWDWVQIFKGDSYGGFGVLDGKYDPNDFDTRDLDILERLLIKIALKNMR